MKFGIDLGHNVAYDGGAVGIRGEDELIREVGFKVINMLRELKHTVVYCTPSKAISLIDSLSARVKTANENRVDYFVCLHFNAGGGRGTEVYAHSEGGRRLAQRVLDEIVKLGFVNRGVKDGAWLYVIKHTDAPAILIECCFVDSKGDLLLYNSEEMARAIVRGLVENAIEAQGEKIIELQRALNRIKIKDAKGEALIEDGIKGPKTRGAIREFQALMGLYVDGIAGEKTWQAINSVLSRPQLSLNCTAYFAVRYVQWRLSVIIDGIFGNKTLNAVYNWQRKQGLIVDGIVGPITWKSFLK